MKDLVYEDFAYAGLAVSDELWRQGTEADCKFCFSTEMRLAWLTHSPSWRSWLLCPRVRTERFPYSNANGFEFTLRDEPELDPGSLGPVCKSFRLC